MIWFATRAVLSFFLIGLPVAVAQDTSNREQESNTSSVQSSNSPLRFSRPQIIDGLKPKPLIAGRFDCSDDGSIFKFIDGYAPNTGTTPKQRIELLAIHPNGTVTNFRWRSISGFTDITLPKSVFVGKDRIYLLVKGAHDHPNGGRLVPYPLVLTFDLHGKLLRTVMLEQGLDPLVLGVFRSGSILVVSEDRLNHRMGLDLVAANGVTVRQLDLGENDYLLQSPKMPHGDQSWRYNSTLLVSMAKFFPFADHLLLVPLETSGLPVIELSEHGVVKAVVPQLPKGTILDALIGVNKSSLTARLATIVLPSHPTLDPEGNLSSFGTIPSQQITDFNNKVRFAVPVYIATGEVGHVLAGGGYIQGIAIAYLKGAVTLIQGNC